MSRTREGVWGSLLGHTLCESLGLSFPIFEIGGGGLGWADHSRSEGLRRAEGCGRQAVAAGRPPGQRGGSAHERRGRRGPAVGRGGSARGPAQAAAEPNGRACGRGAADSCGTLLSGRPPAGPRAAPPAGSRAARAPVSGLGPGPGRTGPGKGRGPGGGAVTHSRAEGVRVPARASATRRGTAGEGVRGRPGRE